jgi:hypothetical protein
MGTVGHARGKRAGVHSGAAVDAAQLRRQNIKNDEGGAFTSLRLAACGASVASSKVKM